MVINMLQRYSTRVLLIACATTLANANFIYQTRTNDVIPLPAAVAAPPPTEAPAPELRKRQGSTLCGYVFGTVPWSACLGGDICHFNSVYSVLGCCGAAVCDLATSCQPYNSQSPATVTSADGTTFCTDAQLPSCAVLSYAGSLYYGFTRPVCGTAAETLPIYYYLNKTGIQTTIVGRTSTSTTTIVTTTTPPVPPSPISSSTPVGAIVGGVVGGIAALAMIALVVFFILRQRKKDANAQRAVVTEYHPPPLDQMQGYDPNYDRMNRSSVAKSPVTMVSGMPSPPGYQHQATFDGNQMSTPVTMNSSGYNMGHEQSVAYEMPILRQERHIQEMPSNS